MNDQSSRFLNRLRQAGVASRAAGRSAVVLERLARGGGATNWYYCPDDLAIEAAAQMWRPGSELRFVFDGRLGPSTWTSGVAEQLLSIAPRRGDALFGVLDGDGPAIQMTLVCEQLDLQHANVGMPAFFGEFPPASEGDHIVSVVLPDCDGVVRSWHPY